jgi:hypothetical protein
MVTTGKAKGTAQQAKAEPNEMAGSGNDDPPPESKAYQAKVDLDRAGKKPTTLLAFITVLLALLPEVSLKK